MRFSRTLAATCLLCSSVSAIDVDVDDVQSVRDAASTIAFGLMSYYSGNNTGDVPGNLPDPYFWWKAGAMFGTMVDYWFMTGDDTYNNVTMQALLHQTGEENDFMPQNQTRTLGNDDQGFWTMAAMSAAENKFPDPPDDQPQWLSLAQACFNQWAARWDEESCRGGLRWQIFAFNGGFDYKNSISNGCFFNIAARLARFTGNETYANWATKIWDWEVDMGLITEDYEVFDGVTVEEGSSECPRMDTDQWTYNSGIFLHGAAVLANFTEEDIWRQRTEGLLDQAESRFFNESVIQERRCEPFEFCNLDQRSFKGYLIRWMSGTAQVVPGLYDRIMGLLRPNAVGAAAACSGNPDEDFAGIEGTACGLRWQPRGFFDGWVGVGEQMNALSAVMYTLTQKEEQAPVTADTGGTSRGNPSAGNEPHHYPWDLPDIDVRDRVAAGFLTSGVALSVLGACFFMLKD